MEHEVPEAGSANKHAVGRSYQALIGCWLIIIGPAIVIFGVLNFTLTWNSAVTLAVIWLGPLYLYQVVMSNTSSK